MLDWTDELDDIVVGSGAAPSHHGEILQGMFSVGGQPRNGLVTLPCTLYMSRARFRPDISSLVTVTPRWKTKARRAAEVAIAELGDRRGRIAGGRLEIMNPAPVGRGFGSSTSDVLAAIRAVGDAFAVEFTVAEVARIAVVAETASDSLMFENSAVLFAQRDGEIIEDFGKLLPGMHVLGFTTGSDVEIINTLSLTPIAYPPKEIAVFGELRSILREAVTKQDADLVGQVATVSAEVNQRYRPMAGFDRLRQLARESEATGIQVSHSGNIVGLLFKDDDQAMARLTHAEAALRTAGIHRRWRFRSEFAAAAGRVISVQ